MLRMAHEGEVRVEVDEVNWGHPPDSRALAREILERAGAALLPDLLGRALRPFPLPAVDLGSVDPAFAGVRLRIVSPQAAHLMRYQFLAGDLAAGPP